ncbi:hypothetical protein ACFZDK_02670 [Streptomyces sp. NPDC007901]|uniref:hypothetical protein n=1 Tax=Streptomyces sp. NPDC007901 TaxID=3364785 RepID=UPI0036F0D5F4
MAQNMKPEIGPRVPYPLGYAEATTSTQTVAAPLLSAAALSLVGVIIVDSTKFRWPEVTLLLVVASSISLIASIQIGADARKYLYNRATIQDWYTDEQAKRSAALAKHSEHFIQWRVRNRRAVVAFNAGTTLLILAVSSALFPRDNHAVVRWIASGMTLASALVEAWWIYRLFHQSSDETPDKPKSLDGGTS